MPDPDRDRNSEPECDRHGHPAPVKLPSAKMIPESGRGGVAEADEVCPDRAHLAVRRLFGRTDNLCVAPELLRRRDRSVRFAIIPIERVDSEPR